MTPAIQQVFVVLFFILHCRMRQVEHAASDRQILDRILEQIV